MEMPGLQLTVPQASRLWGLDLSASRLVIDTLVEASFLRWTARGTVIRTEVAKWADVIKRSGAKLD